jgi:hypothetical protein
VKSDDFFQHLAEKYGLPFDKYPINKDVNAYYIGDRDGIYMRVPERPDIDVENLLAKDWLEEQVKNIHNNVPHGV